MAFDNDFRIVPAEVSDGSSPLRVGLNRRTSNTSDSDPTPSSPDHERIVDQNPTSQAGSTTSDTQSDTGHSLRASSEEEDSQPSERSECDSIPTFESVRSPEGSSSGSVGVDETASDTHNMPIPSSECAVPPGFSPQDQFTNVNDLEARITQMYENAFQLVDHSYALRKLLDKVCRSHAGLKSQFHRLRQDYINAIAMLESMERNKRVTEAKKIVEREFISAFPIIAQRWALQKKLGSGGQSTVYQAIDFYTGGQAAVKIEEVSDVWNLALGHEARLYDILQTKGQSADSPHSLFYGNIGVHGVTFSVMVMNIFGSSLLEFLHVAKRVGSGKLSAMATSNIGTKLLNLIEDIHDKGVLHLDIKPGNIVTSLKNPGDFHLIDYGLSEEYLYKNGDHKPYRAGLEAFGTAEYASPQAHRMEQQSRRSDLWSLFYILLEMLCGKLPWEVPENTSVLERWAFTGIAKQNLSVEQLMKGMRGRGEMMEFQKTLENCEYAERPDYAKVRRILYSLGEDA